MSSAPRRPILIAGPTASGKSALALALAKRIDGVVINADSMQVYRELAILTARPTAEEMASVPHRLYGHLSGHEAYSAARFASEAATVVAEAQAAGLVPIVVGGTGLYFRALTEGLSPMPAIPNELRLYWRRRAADLGSEALHDELSRRDLETASRLNPADTQRITRALEVIDATGRSITSWQSERGRPVIPSEDALKLVLRPERSALFTRCDARFDAMLSTGALDEVRQFLRLEIPTGQPVWGALGLRPLAQQLRGELTHADAVALSKTSTRQLAKRQLTWLRRYNIAWNIVHWQDLETTTRKIDSFVDLLLDLP